MANHRCEAPVGGLIAWRRNQHADECADEDECGRRKQIEHAQISDRPNVRFEARIQLRRPPPHARGGREQHDRDARTSSSQSAAAAAQPF